MKSRENYIVTFVLGDRKYNVELLLETEKFYDQHVIEHQKAIWCLFTLKELW